MSHNLHTPIITNEQSNRINATTYNSNAVLLMETL